MDWLSNINIHILRVVGCQHELVPSILTTAGMATTQHVEADCKKQYSHCLHPHKAACKWQFKDFLKKGDS